MTNILQPMFPYTGNKAKQTGLILHHIPKGTNLFVDVFGGSGVVSMNVAANTNINVSYNEIDRNVRTLFFHCISTTGFVGKIEQVNLRYTNDKEGYLALRDSCNKQREGVEKYAMLYCLIARSFSNICRYNSKGLFNAPYGQRNHLRLDALKEARTALSDKGIGLLGVDYKNVLKGFTGACMNHCVYYLDPPYGASTATYNSGWSEQDSVEMREILDKLTSDGAKWMYHDVLCNRGKENLPLVQWLGSNSYNVVDSNGDFSNSSFRKTSGKTQEILITNY